MNNTNLKNFYIGLSMGSNSANETGVAVMDKNFKIISLDKLHSMSDIEHYFEILPSKKDSIICISIPENPTMLNGKWKLISRAYQLMRSNALLLNNDKWADRFSTRGCECYNRLKEEGISGVVCGFTSHEILSAICAIIDNVETGKPFFLNCYPSVVKPEGNPAALKIIHDMMKSCDATWRGLGVIKNSGLELNDEYANFDARKKYNLRKIEDKQNPACRCGEILQGKCRPDECPCFGKNCTPEHPIGACMVSSEGSCSAFYKYGANNSL